MLNEFEQVTNLVTYYENFKEMLNCVVLLDKFYSLDSDNEDNEVSRQKTKTKVEKDFYKLMKNSNFGNDCRNNIDNCSFRPIYDDIEEISYIQKYTSLYNNDDYKDFACPETIRQQIEQNYSSEIMLIKEDNLCAEEKIHCAGQKRAKKMDSVESMIAKVKRKKIFRDQKTINHLKNVNTKMIIEFDCESSVSINSLAVSKTNVVKLTTRYFQEKCLCLPSYL